MRRRKPKKTRKKERMKSGHESDIFLKYIIYPKKRLRYNTDNPSEAYATQKNQKRRKKRMKKKVIAALLATAMCAGTLTGWAMTNGLPFMTPTIPSGSSRIS